MKFLKLALLFTFTLFYGVSSAQLSKVHIKSIKKGLKYYKKGKYEESAEKFKEVLLVAPYNDKLWAIYSDARLQYYIRNDRSAYTMTIESEDGEELDSSALLMVQLMNKIMRKPEYDWTNSVIDASMYCPRMEQSSSVARSLFVDSRYWNDTMMSEKSESYYDKAEGEFGNENYDKAISYYKKALKADSSNYKAVLHLGDSYYATEYYGKAADYFRQAADMQPLQLQPLKYLSDALEAKDQIDEALEITKKSLMVVPDEGMFIRLELYLEDEGKNSMHREWIQRKCMVNSLKEDSDREEFFEDFSYFDSYQDALEDAKEYYDTNGILKSTVTKPMDTYLEVYSFKQMLKETRGDDIEELEYAREMEEKGMLEPYLMISLYNVDLYDQYRHLVDNNPALVEKYINDYLIGEKIVEEDYDDE